jgi:hypothetical protein
VAEFEDPAFVNTSPQPLFSIIENERFGLVFYGNWVYKYGHLCFCPIFCINELQLGKKGGRITQLPCIYL